jgi:ribosomal protein S18 acetylase RimI-like enzyme
MSINIRLATIGDATRLAKWMNKINGDPIDWTITKIELYVLNNFVLIAEDTEKDNQIIGRLFFQVTEQPFLGVGEIQGVVIDKYYQGKGVGKSLLSKAILESEKYFDKWGIKNPRLFLYTRSSDESAKNLYKQFGFRENSLIGKMFRENRPDELLMSKGF